VRLLLDENLSPRLVELLAATGHEVAHVRELGLQSATDEDIFDRAAADRSVLVTEDTDFGAILVRRKSATPSVIRLRRAGPERDLDQWPTHLR
jgi:predicted nuclease of predicted toxin-antitoxin system